MPFIAFAVMVGLAVGVGGGGSLRHLGDRSFRGWQILAAGLVAQAAAEAAGGGWVTALVVASYGMLAAFAAVNLHLVGMAVVLVGLSMNLTVILANGAVPVRADALVSAGVAERHELAGVDLGAKRRLERPGDSLVALADIIPAPGARQVLSFGDLVLAMGVANVVTRLLLPPGRHHRRPAPTPAPRRWWWSNGAHARSQRPTGRHSPECS